MQLPLSCMAAHHYLPCPLMPLYPHQRRPWCRRAAADGAATDGAADDELMMLMLLQMEIEVMEVMWTCC